MPLPPKYSMGRTHPRDSPVSSKTPIAGVIVIKNAPRDNVPPDTPSKLYDLASELPIPYAANSDINPTVILYGSIIVALYGSIKSVHAGTGKLTIKVKRLPIIINGIVAIIPSRIARRCFCSANLAKGGSNPCSIQSENLFIFFLLDKIYTLLKLLSNYKVF